MSRAKQEAIDFLYKHGDFTRTASHKAIELLTGNGFVISDRRVDFSNLQSHSLAPLFHHLRQTVEALGGGIEFTAALNEVSAISNAVEAEINRLTSELEVANGKR